MKQTKEIIRICREIPAIEVDKEGNLRGGFVGISGIQPRISPNSECINDECNNPGCINIDCINVNGCYNKGCTNAPGTTATPTPRSSSGGSYVSLSFLL